MIAACIYATLPCILHTQIIKDSSLLVKITEYTSNDSISWVKNYEELYTYNQNGLLIRKAGKGTRRGDFYAEYQPNNSRHDYYWNSFDFMDSITYNKDNLVSELYHFDNINHVIDYSRYTYCPDDSICELYIKSMTTGYQSLIKVSKTEFNYDNHRIQSKIYYQSLDTNLGIPQSRYNYVWKNNNSEFDIVLQSYSGGSWINGLQIGNGKLSISGILLYYQFNSESYNYDSTGNIIQYHLTGPGNDSKSIEYKYQNNIIKFKQKTSLVEIYPDPPAPPIAFWGDYCLTTYYYDSSNKIINDVTNVLGNPGPKAYDKTEYTYNNSTVDVK